MKHIICKCIWTEYNISSTYLLYIFLTATDIQYNIISCWERKNKKIKKKKFHKITFWWLWTRVYIKNILIFFGWISSFLFFCFFYKFYSFLEGERKLCGVNSLNIIYLTRKTGMWMIHLKCVHALGSMWSLSRLKIQHTQNIYTVLFKYKNMFYALEKIKIKK